MLYPVELRARERPRIGGWRGAKVKDGTPRAAAVAIACLLGACVSKPEVTLVDQRGRRIVDLDRPVMATEYHFGRRVFRIDQEAVPDGPASFSLGIEVQDLDANPPRRWEREFVLPDPDVKLFFVVRGDAGRPFWSREAQGNVRVRQFDDRTSLSVDLSFKGQVVDRALKLPIYTWLDDPDRVHVAGAFTAPFPAKEDPSPFTTPR